jgi:zinc resistance-associated protein
MWKHHAKGAIVVAATVAMVGWSIGVAQPFREPPEGPRASAASREDAIAYLEARIAALHSGLQLTPEQERIWPPFEQAYRDMAKLRLERTLAGGEAPRMQDPIARMQQRADALIVRGTVLKRLAEASVPLWRSFDEGQKRRFAVLARPTDQQTGFGGRPYDEGRGPGGRGGDQFGYGSGPRRMGPGGPFGQDGNPYEYGPARRPNGPGGPPGRDNDEFGYGSGPPGMAPGGRDGDQFGPGREPRRMMPGGPDRDSGRDQGRDQMRGQFRWWPGPPDARRGAREGREPGDPGRDYRTRPPGNRGERNDRGDYQQDRL